MLNLQTQPRSALSSRSPCHRFLRPTPEPQYRNRPQNRKYDEISYRKALYYSSYHVFKIFISGHIKTHFFCPPKFSRPSHPTSAGAAQPSADSRTKSSQRCQFLIFFFAAEVILQSFPSCSGMVQLFLKASMTSKREHIAQSIVYTLRGRLSRMTHSGALAGKGSNIPFIAQTNLRDVVAVARPW